MILSSDIKWYYIYAVIYVVNLAVEDLPERSSQSKRKMDLALHMNQAMIVSTS